MILRRSRKLRSKLFFPAIDHVFKESPNVQTASFSRLPVANLEIRERDARDGVSASRRTATVFHK
jgi:hypothetical protein